MKSKFRIVSAIIIIFIIIEGALGAWQISSYDKSVLEIYAGQQDAYVQLVLDQINLQADRSDDEIITEILGSLDSSSGKYWTLSKEQALLFVKDVMETNRYKGFTTETYYISDSAAKFLENLTQNKVIHQMITMDGEDYVASGVAFSYGDNVYRICLLTNRTVILDNNSFLSAKISISILGAIALFVLLVLCLTLTGVIEKKQRENTSLKERLEAQNRTIDLLGEKLKELDLYETRWNLFQESVLGSFIEKLQNRKAFPVTVVQITFKEENEQERFLAKAQLLLDKKILRFSLEDGGLLLLFVQYEKNAALEALKLTGQDTYEVLASGEWNEGKQTLNEVYLEVRKQGKEHGCEAVSGI